MFSLQSTARVGRTKALSSPAGLAGWLLNRLSGVSVKRQADEKKMHLIETLSLGGKRNLMLVSCAGELFLVGGSFEGVESIVRVQSEQSRNLAVKVDGLCS
jgi:flagellar biogenesis protein FliO